MTVISSCVGDIAHARSGRPNYRRLPQRVRDLILQLVRTAYSGLNDNHLCEKLCVYRSITQYRL